MQDIIIILACSFAILLLAPIIGASLYYKTHKGEILHINQNRVRDARYFGKSFSAFIENNLKNVQGNTIKLSREEIFINGDTEKNYKRVVEQLVICQNEDFNAPKDVKEFQKEIYGAGNVILKQKGLEIRAAFAKGNMLLGNEIQVGRWIDAEGTMTIYDNCSLGFSASSAACMSIGKNCSFRRLYAPEIRLGQYPWDQRNASDGKDKRIYRLPVHDTKEYNVKYISKEMINEDGIVEFSVLSWRNVIVTEHVIVQGDVRSHKGVKLSDGAVVCGNIFAEEDVILGRNACVLGNIFSQEDIYLEEGAVVGQRNRICSMIARGRITFEKDNFVFGYVSCEKGGFVVPQKVGEQKEISSEKMSFLAEKTVLQNLDFKDLYDYEHVDQQGFRFQNNWRSVTIPAGASVIPQSMFYHCASLKRVSLPDSVQSVKDYAFADCSELRKVSGLKNTQIKIIGTSAFENCVSLKRIVIPASVEVIEGAAFSKCENLINVKFEEGSQLKKIGEHCFRGCRKLKCIRLPLGVLEVGISAFMECSNLSNLEIPAGCQEEPGILECDQTSVEVYSL